MALEVRNKPINIGAFLALLAFAVLPPALVLGTLGAIARLLLWRREKQNRRFREWFLG